MNFIRLVLPFEATSIKPLTQMNSCLIRAWVQAAGDPDVHVADWLDYGAPAGILRHAEQVNVFPPSFDPVDEAKQGALQHLVPGFANYVSMEDAPQGESVLADLVDKGFVMRFDKHEAAVSYLGQQPIVSKLALISTIKDGVEETPTYTGLSGVGQ